MKKLFILIVLMAIFSPAARAQMMVFDLDLVQQIVGETSAWKIIYKSELRQFAAELEHFAQVKNHWTKEIEYYLNKYNVFQRIYDINCSYMDKLDAMRIRVEDFNFKWDPIKLQEIDDIMNSPMFKFTSGTDPYGGIFSSEGTVESSFTNLKYRENIYESGQYQNNPIMKDYFNAVLAEEDRTIQDFNNRKNLLAKVNEMQIESEKRLKNFEKVLMAVGRLDPDKSETQETKYMRLSNFLSWNTEMSLEHCREMLQQILVKKIQVETQILKRLRQLYLEKLEQTKEVNANNNNILKKDQEVVTNMFSEK